MTFTKYVNNKNISQWQLEGMVIYVNIKLVGNNYFYKIFCLKFKNTKIVIITCRYKYKDKISEYSISGYNEAIN